MRLIDADALIVDIKECIEAKDSNYEWEQVEGLEVALSCVDDAPTIDERKTGKWIVDPYKGTLTCSTCKEEFSCFPSIGWKPLWDFCPYCGSRNESAKLTEGGGKE